MTKFWLKRHKDLSGVSGTGTVAEGVVFSNGEAVVHWLSKLSSICVYGSLEDVKLIHGHDGLTDIEIESDDTDPEC